MACSKFYFAPNGKPSELFNFLKNTLGENFGEEVYLRTQTDEFIEKYSRQMPLDANGDPTVEFVSSLLLDGVFDTQVFRQKRDIADIERMLLDSSTSIAPPEDSFYNVAGKNLPRVSKVVDEKIPYRGGEAGDQYKDKGTVYHHILARMIELMNNGDSSPEDKIVREFPLKKEEMVFVSQIKNVIENIKSRYKGENKLISELRIAASNINAGKGIAGSVDILFVYDNGRKADIYDMKTVFETAWKRRFPDKYAKQIWNVNEDGGYKAERYSHQLVAYGGILSVPDDVTGRQPIQVVNHYIIPVQVLQKEEGGQEVIRGISVLPPENIQDYMVGNRSPYREAKTWFDDIKEGRKRTTGITGIAEASTVDLALPKMLGIETPTPNFEKQSIHIVESNWAKESFLIGQDKISWEADDKPSRVTQVRNILENNALLKSGRMSDAIAKAALGEWTGIFRYNEETNAASPHAVRLRKVFASADPLTKDTADVVMLKDVSGFEAYDDIVLIARGDGGYDMFRMSNEWLDRELITSKDAFFREILGTSTKTLFGNHIDPIVARERGVTIGNTLRDYHALRMGMIGIQLAHVSPSFRISRIIQDNIYNRSEVSPRAHDMGKIVKDIQTLMSLGNVKDIPEGSLKDALENPAAFTSVSSQGTYVDQLLDYMKKQIESNPLTFKNSDKLNPRGKVQAALQEFKNDQISRDQLADEIRSGVLGIQSLIQSRYGAVSNIREIISEDPEIQLLAKIYMDLKGSVLNPEKDQSDELFGMLSRWIKNPATVGRQTFEKWIDMFRRHYDIVRRKLTAFNNEKSPVFNELIRDSPAYKRGLAVGDINVAGSDTLFAMGMSVFEDLLEYKTSADGTRYKTLRLIQEGSADFDNLSKAQQRTIKFFNDKVQEAFPGWPRGLIPAMRASANTRLYMGKEAIAQGNVKDAIENSWESIKRWFVQASERGNDQINETAGRDMMHGVADHFSGMIVQDLGTYNSDVLNRFGLDENLNLVSIENNNDVEINLEQILTRFVHHYIRKDQMEKALPEYHMIRSIIKLYDVAYGLKQTHNIEQMDAYIQDLVFNTKQAEEKIITNAVNVMVRSTSAMLLGYNPKVPLKNTAQMWTQGLISSVTNSMTGDSRFPGVKNWLQAAGEMMKMGNPVNATSHAIKLMMMLEQYLPKDIPELTGSAYMRTSSGLLNDQVAFALDRMATHGIRTQHLLAQMIKDGSYEAHSVEQEPGSDGLYRWVLKYDPKKDKQFQGDYGQKLYDYVKKDQQERGLLTPSGEISMAYDWHTLNRLDAYINQQVGTTDRSLSSHISRFSIMSALMQFRNWFRDMYQRSTKHQYPSELFGELVETENGLVWSPSTMKGILWTLADLGQIVKNYKGWKNIDREDRRNIIYAANSLAAMGLLIAGMSMIDDDDEDEMSPLLTLQTASYYSGLMYFITLSPFTNMTVDPLVFASFYERLFHTMGTAVMVGEKDPGKAWDMMAQTLPVIRDVNSLIDHENE